MNSEKCAICGCSVHRKGDYAKPTIQGRSHATKHHYVAERFFGRSANRKGTQRNPIFKSCPWTLEKETAIFCYECHEELIHNPVLLPEDIERFHQLVSLSGLIEIEKGESSEMHGKRIRLFHEAIALGFETLLEKHPIQTNENYKEAARL